MWGVGGGGGGCASEPFKAHLCVVIKNAASIEEEALMRLGSYGRPLKNEGGLHQKGINYRKRKGWKKFRDRAKKEMCAFHVENTVKTGDEGHSCGQEKEGNVGMREPLSAW